MIFYKYRGGMFMFKRKIILILALVILFYDSHVFAYGSYNNKTALSVGASYSDLTSSVSHANYSYDTFVDMGLTTKKITNTTMSNMTSSHGNGTSYLESGIVFLCGHAGYNNMGFSNDVTVDVNSSIFNTTIGIRYYNNSKSALIIFGGCETAKQNYNNLASAAYSHGAQTTMGWTTELNIGSYKNWNKRFDNKIKDKTTSSLAAAQYASSFTYLFNNVKNYKLYGGYNNNPWYYMTTMQIANPMNNSQLFQNNNISELRSNNYIKEQIKDINLDNFKLEINGVHETYYDYVLYVNDIRTSLGYTVVENNKTNTFSIFDNMNNYDYEEIRRKISSKNLNDNQFKNARNSILNNISNNKKDDNYEITNEIKYYDVEKNQVYYVIEVKTIYAENDVIYTNYEEEI